MEHLCHNSHSLLNVILGKLMHLCLKIALHQIHIIHCQLETLKIIDALYSEHASRWEQFLTNWGSRALPILEVADQGHMIDDHVLVATGVDYLLVFGGFGHGHVDHRKHLVVVAGMHKSSQAFGRNVEVAYLVTLPVEIFSWLFDRLSQALPKEGKKSLVLHFQEEWVCRKHILINLHDHCHSQSGR